MWKKTCKAFIKMELGIIMHNVLCEKCENDNVVKVSFFISENKNQVFIVAKHEFLLR
jgi:hypothetical protein